MKKPLLPENEKQRLQALQQLNILDTQPEDRFDRLTRIAKRYFKVPIALVSLVDVNRQWFKSHQGLDATETPRDISFCGHAILDDILFIIPDTLADNRFADNPLVTGPPDIRFYAGAPLIDKKGYRLGTLCIIDTKPRDFSAQDFDVLRDLADAVQAELARTGLLKASRILKASEQQIYEKNRLLDAISRAQSRFIQDVNVQSSFTDMLNELLELTSSHLGFIAEVVSRADGSAYLKAYALTSIVWDDELKHYYADNAEPGRVLDHSESLLGAVLAKSQVIISNDIATQTELSGFSGVFSGVFPDGYPELTAFLGIPVYQAGQLSGVVGLANRQQGYDQALVDYLSPLISTIGTLIEAAHNELRRKLISDELSRFKYALDHTLDMIFMFDSETLQFNYLNEGAVHSMAYSKAELLQLHAYDIKPLVSRDEFIKLIEPLKSGQSESLNFETVHRRKDGVDFPVDVTLQLVRESTGTQRFIAVVHDITERKAYENKLLDAEQQMRGVIDTVVDGIITIDMTGIVRSFNPAAEHIFAYSAQQVIGQNIKMLMPDPYQKEHDGYLQHYMHTGERKVIGIGREVTGLRQTGEHFPMELAVNEMTVKGERMFTGIVRDITQRKEIERQLYETNTIRKGILDSANFSIIYTNKEGLIQSFNHCAELMLGYSAEEVVGKSTPGILHDVDEVVARAAELSAETGKHIEPGFAVFITKPRQNKTDEREWTYIRKDGSRFPVLLSLTSVTDAQGEIMGFLGIGKDLSAQKLAEAEVQARDARLRAIVDTVVDGIIVINAEGLVQTFNPAAETLFGYTAEEILGRNVNQLMMDYYTSENIAHLLYENSSAGTQDTSSREMEGRHKDGSSFPMELSISEMQIHGEIMYTSIVRDITERKRIDKMKSQFVSTVSHELRTPLTSIRGALGLVLAGAVGEVSKEAMEMLQMANRNSVSLTLLINDILDLEKIESGRMEFDFITLDLNKLVKHAVETNQGYADEHQVKLKVTGESSSLYVSADENRLLQVFANLLSNAVKYSPENGCVEITLSQDEGWARVSIRDKGHGIPAEFHSRIFQRFAQADSSDTREKGGTGLGLSISRAIIEQHHGHIGFTSEPDVETIFYFELPETTHVTVSDTESTDEIRVLICEDNPDVSHVLSVMLKNEGLVCDVAASAAGAKKLIEQNAYKVMLLDLGLPDQQGVDLIRELKSNEQNRELPIIVVSALATETKKQLNGEAVIVVDWIQKPVDKNRLFKAINNALSGTTRPRVLHVEDSLDVVQITGAIIGEMAEYEYATSLNAARKLIKKQNYDLLILDIKLPDGSGLDLLPEIDNKCPVIIFSGEEVDRDIKNEIAAILTKSETSNDQLMETIRNVIYRSRK